jgi:prolyl-tRNA synthetase
VIISPRNIKDGCCEIVSRDKSLSVKEPLESGRDKVTGIVKDMLKRFN